MPLADYPDLSWLIRAVRVLPVVAVAALVGGIIGGFTVFAIDSALTWQPRPDLRADNQSDGTTAGAQVHSDRRRRHTGSVGRNVGTAAGAATAARGIRSVPSAASAGAIIDGKAARGGTAANPNKDTGANTASANTACSGAASL